MSRWLRSVVPAPIKRPIRSWTRRVVLTVAVVQIRRRMGKIPSERLLRRLSYGWGNCGRAASISYLRHIATMASQTDGAIIELGSGVSTIVLAASKRPDQALTTLEHLPVWTDRIRARVKKFPNVTVLARPLWEHETFDWYRLETNDFPIAATLVICDGPPGTTRGGRVGALPMLQPFLAPLGTLVLDDAERPEEQRALADWVNDFRITVEMTQGERGFADVRWQAASDEGIRRRATPES